MLDQLRRPIVWISLMAVLVGIAILAVRNADHELKDLGRLRSAGQQAAENSRIIEANLDEIERNLAAGARLPESTDEIHGLTLDQHESLRELADLLRTQLASIKRTVGSLRETERSAEDVARLSAQQASIIDRTVTALKRLEAFAQRAGAASADTAQRAVYGARLAEDSQRSFSEP